MNYPTPHINATPDDFGQTVLMPGDPLRSKYIAEHFLENARLVNNVRGVQGYTGTYHGVKVSVMASGMGIPSIGIYSYELYNAFGVQNIMRIGSAGSINPDIHVRDIVIAQGACTDSNFLHQYHIDGHKNHRARRKGKRIGQDRLNGADEQCAQHTRDRFNQPRGLPEQEAAKPPRALTPQRHGDGRSLRKILQADAERDADRAHDRLRRRAALQRPEGHADGQPFRDIVQRDREDKENDMIRPASPPRSAAGPCDHAVRGPEEDGTE